MPLKQRYRRILLFVIIISILFTPGANVPFAEKGQDMISEALSIVMVVDVSGSMRRTDPQMLRETAAHVFIDLLGPEDHLGIVIFDHEAELIVPLQPVQSAEKKEWIKATLSPKLEPRGYTDFKVALKTAFTQFQEADLERKRPVVVLLTDGEPNPGPGWGEDEGVMAAYMESLWQEVNLFARQEIPIYTIGFSDEIDPAFMARLSLESRGDYYVHAEPTELAVTFFELLGRLKNLRGLIRENFTLQDEAKIFPFQVGELTRQVNMVAVNLTGEMVGLEMIPPGGVGDSVNVTVESLPGYSLAVLHQPDQAYWGAWNVAVRGRGQIQLMADTDLHVKAWLESPTPGSQHPLHEPVHFKIELTRGVELGQVPLQVEVLLNKPGRESVTIPLTEQENYFKGVYAGADQIGDYLMQVRILMGDEVFSSFNERLYVRHLPSLATDFWGGEGVRLGEEVLLTASMNMGGRRLQQGRELDIKTLHFEFVHAGGEKITVPLYDSGDPEHGDIRAGDGIYSNLFTFTEAGTYQPVLLAGGHYEGSAFMLEKNPELFQVHPPGKVLIGMGRKDFWSSTGSVVTLPLNLQNLSPFRETVFVGLSRDVGVLSDTAINLEPGEKKVVNLTLELRDSLEEKEYNLLLHFRPEYHLTQLEAANIHIKLGIMTPVQLFVRNFFHVLLVAGAVMAVVLALLCLFYVGGMLLYRIIIYPKTMVVGTFTVELEPFPRKLKLWKIKKNRVVITFNPEHKNAHFYIEGSEYTHDIIMQTLCYSRYPLFIQGWKGVLERHIPIRTIIKCTPPGIIEANGKILTEKELFHSDVFETGGFIFRYENPYGKWYKEKGDGIDLLEGKV